MKSAAMRHLATTTAIVWVTLGGLSACASHVEPGALPPRSVVSTVPGVTVVPALTDTAQLTLPIDAYLPSDSQIDHTSEAMTALETQCMGHFGFQLSFPVPPAPSDGPNARRYGVPESLEVAREYGFHMPKGDPRDAPSTRVPAFSEAERDVFTGVSVNGTVTEYQGIQVPSSGCAGQADRTIAVSAGTKAGHSSLAESIQADSFVHSMLDPRVIQAQRQWVTCMNSAGYPRYKQTFDAGGDSRWNTPHATALEREVAVADWNCAKRVGLVSVWAAVESAYQRQQIALHTEQLDEAVAELRAQAARIASILRNPGTGSL